MSVPFTSVHYTVCKTTSAACQCLWQTKGDTIHKGHITMGSIRMGVAVSRVGELIRRRRKELGLTQIDLEKRTGVEQYYISQIEIGRVKQPGKGLLITFATALGMDPDELLLAADYAPLHYERMEVDHDEQGTLAVPVRGVDTNEDMGRAMRIPREWVEAARFPMFVVIAQVDGPGTIVAGDTVLCEEYHEQAICEGAIVFMRIGHTDAARTSYTLAAYDPEGAATILGIARQRFGPPS